MTKPLPAETKDRLPSAQWNRTRRDYPRHRCTQALFEQQVARTPNAIALIFQGRSFTYEELNRRANRLAHFLIEKGVQPDMLVGLCLERSPDLVVGLLGILKSGAAYVPLDPAYPRERLATMVEDADMRILVTDSAWAATHLSFILEEAFLRHDKGGLAVVCPDSDRSDIDRHSTANPVRATGPEHLAYTIYTSGSTGKPKGVEIPHRALVNFLTSMAGRPGLAEHDTLLAVTTISFDIAALEILLPLITGATVVLASREASASGPGLIELIRESNPTVMQATPATWYLLLAADWAGHPGLEILCGGEALPRALAERLLETGAHLWNLYGPTETTIWSTVYEVGGKERPMAEDPGDPRPVDPRPLDTGPVDPGPADAGPADAGPVSEDASSCVDMPIGTPIANTTLHILDEGMQPVPVGSVGELHIGGDGLARGYRNRPDLTAERFVANPFGRGLLYKTGDVARYLCNGNVELLGRMDHQVKIRGFRIELGEIEAILHRHPGVHRSVVTVHEDEGVSKIDDTPGAGNKRLVAYVVPDWHYRPETEAEEEIRSGERQVSQWGRLWDLAYARQAPGADATFNISGWNDSYTGAPIPADDMREWVDTTVERILSLKPDRVLEIGCGTGMLLFRVAPHCSWYCGSDVAPNALRYIAAHEAHFAGDWPTIRLRQGAADDFDHVAPGTLDTILINSVVQMFPGVHYLVDVLEKAVKVIRPGGAIFVGDVRSRRLLKAFHASIRWGLSPDTLSRDEFRHQVQRAMAMEGQLVVDPDFFIALKRHLPAIGHVEIQLRRGHAANEMNRFRFDAILHIGKKTAREITPAREMAPARKVTPAREVVPAEEVAPLEEAHRHDWRKERLTRAWVRARLTEPHIEALLIQRIPNARIAGEMRLLALLEDEAGPETVGALRRTLGAALDPAPSSAGGLAPDAADAEDAVEPETWWHLAHEMGYTACVGWSSDPGCYDVRFQKASELPARFAETPENIPLTGSPIWSDYANDPLQGQLMGRLEPALRRYLEERLPDYMLPTAFVILDEMPSMPNGKLDRKALPAPGKDRPRLATALVEPRSEIERRVAEVWREVLQLDRVGTLDNFFELGGNSLLLTQAHALLQERLDGRISIVDLFGYPTIRDFARHIAESSDSTRGEGGARQGEGDAGRGEGGAERDEPRIASRQRMARKHALRPVGTAHEDIAIIGLACRFPGADTPERFWENLRDGVESIGFFSDADLEISDPALLTDPNYVRAGAPLPDIDRFDAAFFGYSPREAELMDPQQRLFLECAWEALERAGCNPEVFSGSIGVYAGCGMNTYLLNNIHPHRGHSRGGRASDSLLGSAHDLQIRLANSADSLTSRACYKLGLTGPGVTVQTACSTSLVAIHTACRALRAGECDMALAGGVSITVPQRTGYPYREDMILSPDGHCRAFDADARGTVFGSGSGIVVLKPLDRAMETGDEILAVIEGSAVNNDGASKVGYTAPGVTGQAGVIEAALMDACIDPRTISYVEAHGTGTTLGDPVEITALTRAFRKHTSDRGFCAVGSVKTNVGHLIEAAGVCGLIKTVLALKHKQLPPSLHFQRPNPAIDFQGSPFYVETALSDWDTTALPRRAGVSSFGMGGTNAHVILEEAPPAQEWARSPRADSTRPVRGISTPLDDRSAPLDDRVAPFDDRATPLDDRSTPLDDRSAPLDDRSAPLDDRSAPLDDRVTPFDDRAAPFDDRATPLDGRATPLDDRSAPLDDRSAPLDDRAAPLDGRAAPFDDRAAPFDDRATPLDDRSASLDDRSAPLDGRSTPFDDRAAPFDDRVTPLGDRSTPFDDRSSSGVEMPPPLQILALSARTGEALEASRRRYLDHLDAHPDIGMADLCFTANTGRKHFEHRLAVVADSTSGLREALAGISGTTTVARGTGRPMAFLFTGQGSQYVGMGRQLYDTSPTFRRTLDRCEEILRPLLESTLLDILYPDHDAIPGELDETAYTQPALFALEYALAELWRSWGVRPDVVMGHSIGEYVAACVAGVFDLEDGLKLVAERGRLMQGLPRDGTRRGAMASVAASETYVRGVLSGLADVSIAAVNGPRAVVISGLSEAIEVVSQRLSAAGVETRGLAVSHAFHSALMEPMLDGFERFARGFRFSPPRIPVVSNVTGKVAANEYATAAYWRRHVREQVQFAAGMESIAGLGVGTFVEIGPGPVLLGMGRQCLPDAPGPWLPSLRPGTADWRQLSNSLGDLYEQGASIDWTGFHGDYPRRRVSLPTYPFQRRRHWIDPPDRGRSGAFPSQDSLEDRNEERVLNDALYEPAWYARALRTPPGLPAGHWLIFTDHRGIGERVVAGLRSRGAASVVVSLGREYRQDGEQVFQVDPLAPEHFQRLLRAIPKVRGVVHLWSLDIPDTPDDIDALDRAAEMGCASAAHLVRSLVKSCPELPALWLVTRGAQPVKGSDVVPGVAQSALWGLGKVIGLEHPELGCVLVDLDSEASPEEAAKGLLDELMATAPSDDSVLVDDHSGHPEQQVAFRHGTRYVARLIRRPLTGPPSRPMAFREGASYLITGGLGALGLEVAEWMVARGARHLVLVGRSGVKPEAETRLAAMETAGVEVVVVEADIADADDVKRLFTEIGESMPVLAGIVHGAGVVEFASVWQQDWARFSRVMAPKVRGSWLLHLSTRGLPLDFFVCFSSLAALLGSHGLGSYAAANAFMDALAHHRHALKLPASSIDWGPWGDVGMGAESGTFHRNRFIEWGLSDIAPVEGLSVLGQLLRAGERRRSTRQSAQVGVMPVDWSKWLRQFPRRPAFYDEVVAPEIDTGSRARPIGFLERLDDAPRPARWDLLMNHILARMEETLGMAGIAPGENVMDLGLDSLMAVEFRAWLKSELDCPLRSTLLFDYPTVEALVDYLLQEALTLDDSEETPDDSRPATLVPIQPEGHGIVDGRPLFCVAGVFGNVFDFYPLSRRLGPERPLYGLRSLGLDEDVAPYLRMEDIALHHIEAMQTIRPRGPYAICGYSFGGKVAFEMARQLLRQGEAVSLLAIIDIQVAVPEGEKRVSEWDGLDTIVRFARVYGDVFGKALGASLETDRSRDERELFADLLARLIERKQISGEGELKRLLSVYKANLQAAEGYGMEKTPVPITLLRAAELQSGRDFLPDEAATAADPSWGWRHVSDAVEVEVVPGTHFTMMSEPHVSVLAERLQAHLERPGPKEP